LVHPGLKPLVTVMALRSQTRLGIKFPVGKDGRSRVNFWAFGTVTGRCAPSNSQFVLGGSAAFRPLVKPPASFAQIAFDWSAQLQHSMTDSEKRVDAAAMSDFELVAFLARRLQPLTEEVWTLLPYIREARSRFSQPGRRVPVRGRPTFSAWIQGNLGISDRHVRRILAAAGSTTDIATAQVLVGAKDKRRRDEFRALAIQLACGVFGLDEPEYDDIGGVQHKRPCSESPLNYPTGLDSNRYRCTSEYRNCKQGM
jgi:hypothetical protein